MERENTNKQNNVEKTSLSSSETKHENEISEDVCSAKETDKIAEEKENDRFALFIVISIFLFHIEYLFLVINLMKVLKKERMEGIQKL